MLLMKAERAAPTQNRNGLDHQLESTVGNNLELVDLVQTGIGISLMDTEPDMEPLLQGIICMWRRKDFLGRPWV